MATVAARKLTNKALNRRVTDAGIRQLAALKKLRGLHLAQTNITGKAISWLQAALPECKITR